MCAGVASYMSCAQKCCLLAYCSVSLSPLASCMYTLSGMSFSAPHMTNASRLMPGMDTRQCWYRSDMARKPGRDVHALERLAANQRAQSVDQRCNSCVGDS